MCPQKVTHLARVVLTVGVEVHDVIDARVRERNVEAVQDRTTETGARALDDPERETVLRAELRAERMERPVATVIDHQHLEHPAEPLELRDALGNFLQHRLDRVRLAHCGEQNQPAPLHRPSGQPWGADSR